MEDGWLDEWMGGCMDGGKNQGTDRWMGLRINECKCEKKKILLSGYYFEG